jgi:hypothetical protein
MRQLIAAAASICGLCIGLAHALAADIEWEVENPFRYYKVASSFTLHEAAFHRARGDARTPVPGDIIWRTERRLNDPDCRDATTPLSCAATARTNYEESRLGWAAKTSGAVCYDKTDRPRHYLAQCDRRYSWGIAKEDYVLPPAHTVVLHLSPENLQQAGAGQCVWSWKPRAGSGQGGRKAQPCANKVVIERVPFSLDPAASGVSVAVQLPDGRELTEPNVSVEDLFVVAIGDSFASGESNPDRPVTFSAVREMFYDPLNADSREEIATRNFRGSQEPKRQPAEMIAPLPQVADWHSLPKRLMEDEERSLLYRPSSPQFVAAFERRGADWTSPDCHRSQYGYPFRVSMELALEDRHRAITLVHLACSGADVVEGLFSEKDAREQFERPNSAKVPAQFDQLSDLICRGGSAAHMPQATPAPPKAALDGGYRVALVIGNGAYANANSLPNPPNDARAVARTLREMGFEVIEGTDLNRTGMERMIRDFLRKAPNARLTLLFYAGHGMQVDGKNYLVPTDARLAAPSDLGFETIELDKILAGLDDAARANIIILDACRDNPLARSFASRLGATRSASVPGGLAGYATVGTGTLIAFATAPGQTALDGSNANSPFTMALIKYLRTPGMEVNQMLTRVRVEVASATGNRQIPWANSSLLGDVYLAPAK